MPLLVLILLIFACFLHGFACVSAVGGSPSPPLWLCAPGGADFAYFACFLHEFACFSGLGWLAFALSVLMGPCGS